MAMQFDIADKDKRKYQCFVCGRQYTDFNEFKEHIKTDHTEGQDYVTCPLKRCGAPVRDLKAHFKARHPSEKLPKKGMSKAMLWRDIGPKGKVKKRKPTFRQGYFESTKMGKALHYRSGMEEKVYECLDSDNEVVAYDVEPFQIEYIYNGDRHTYTPDIIIEFVGGRKELWEVKPSNQTALEINQAKWHAAEKACQIRGWGWVVCTETVLKTLQQKIKLQRNLGK